MNDIRDQVIARLQGQAMIDFVAQVAGQQPKRSGADYKILCPFHDDHSPSLAINVSKRDSGIFRCFACGWSGDAFDFIGELHGIDNFPDRARFIAERLGMTVDRSVAPRCTATPQRAVESAPSVETMTAAEVLDAYRELGASALDPTSWCEQLGVDPWSLEAVGGLVAPMRDRTVLVVPMRSPDGKLASLRFRCFDTKKRWSLDAKERVDGRMRQVKNTRAGLMAHHEVWDPTVCLDDIITLVIEGETDLLAAMTMMRRTFGDDDPAVWPARWIALPGVQSCHDLLLESRLSRVVLCFFDGDVAAREALFSQRPRRRADDGTMEKQLDQPYQQRLLARLKRAGYQARAAFPPPAEKKLDLRDLVRDGWGWRRFLGWCLEHGTADEYGCKR